MPPIPPELLRTLLYKRMMTMLVQKLRKAGNSFVVTIPKEEAERQNLQEGDMVSIEVRKVNVKPEMSPEVRAAFERSWKAYEADYRYLEER